MKKHSLIIFFLCFVCALGIQAAPSKIIPFWHSFSGQAGETLKVLTDKFNHQQDKYHVKLVYKGSYLETLTSFVAAFRAKTPPPLVQVFEIGTQTMLHPKGVIKPVYSLFKEQKLAFNEEAFLPAIRRYYSDKENHLLAMPFNSSSAVLFYNKDIFDRAGIKAPPKTWEAVERDARRITQMHLVPCGFTTSFPSWIQIETFLNWHRIPYANKDAGITRLDVELDYEAKALHHHLAKLKSWQKAKLFEYGGRDSNAVSLFSSGHCAMLTQSSGAFMGLKQMVSFTLGVSDLPYWSRFQTKPGTTVIGGAAIWVISGFNHSIYQGIAEYLSFLAYPESQSYWSRQTGYLPLTKQAALLSSNTKDNPTRAASKIALSQISAEGNQSLGARLGYYAQIRLFNDEQVEAICAGTKTVKDALNEAQTHANYLLRRFEKNVSG